MTTARKPKSNPRRRKHRRKKNMSTGAKIAIAAGVVLVGVPLVLITAGALGFRALVHKAERDMPPLDMQPMTGTQGLYTWEIKGQPGSYSWTVYSDAFNVPSLNGPMHSGSASTYRQARSQIDMDIALR